MAAQLHPSLLAKNDFIPEYLYMTYVEEVPMGTVFADIELTKEDDLALVRREMLSEDKVRRPRDVSMAPD